MNKRTQKILMGVFGAIIMSLSIVLGLLLTGAFNPKKPVEPETPPIEVIEIDPGEIEKKKYRENYDSNKEINPDYVGDIFFDSGLLSVNFVQAKSVYKDNGEPYQFYTENGNLVTDPEGYNGNDVYIWTYWKTGEFDYNDNGGSTFMDYRNYLSDQNIIIYGHHFSVWNDETRSKAFTPLEKFLEKENYEANKYVTLVLEHEIRKYVVAAVYNFDATDDSYFDDFQYWRTNYAYDDYTDTIDNDYYSRYIDNVRRVQLYDTGIEWGTNDRTITLQTCISGYTGELFEILVLKELSVESY
ncbi:MAG: class B sortase [Erysipelotrichaceae bacterium]|nr:class B sortase [Erysipelotrichaceae bacterium]